MHELAFTKNILGIALRYAEKTEARKINGIFLRIGVLRDMQPEWLNRYFTYLSKDTIASAAKLYVMPEPVVLACNHCNEKFSPDLSVFADTDEILCPACQSQDYVMESGSEFIIQSIEVE
jgi:hydrogenase nickel incorporation protein HypA/HybF